MLRPYLEKSDVTAQEDYVDGEHDSAEGHNREDRLHIGRQISNHTYQGSKVSSVARPWLEWSFESITIGCGSGLKKHFFDLVPADVEVGVIR